MNKFQEERELTKLSMSNIALKRERDWYKSWIFRMYAPFVFFIASLIYFYFFQEMKITDTIMQSVFFTILFMSADIVASRIAKFIWKNYFYKDEV